MEYFNVNVMEFDVIYEKKKVKSFNMKTAVGIYMIFEMDR